MKSDQFLARLRSMTTFEVAFNLHTRGFSVIPSGARPTHKAPLVPWTEFQSRKPTDEELQTWNGALQPALWGIVTGTISGVVVIDADTADARHVLESEGLQPHVVTPRGGAHYYFKHPGEHVKTMARLLPGVDIRGDGGFCNIAGGAYQIMKMPSADTLYSWDRLPPAVRDAMNSNGHKPVAAQSAGTPALEGERNAALASLAGTMRKRGMSQEAIESALLAENQSRCVPPLAEQEIRDIAKSVGRYAPVGAETTAEAEAVADYGHAEVMASILARRFRWATHRKLWMKYSQGVWRVTGDEQVALTASETLRKHYAKLLGQATGKGDVDRLTKLIRDSCTMARIQGALGFLKGWPGFYTEAADWDSDPWLLNCRDGVLNLKSGDFLPHDPGFLLTKQTGTEYHPDMLCPKWLAHLERFLPSADVRRQVQRSLGVAIVGTVQEEKFDLWYGGGKNGKSTTEKAAMGILDDYAGVCAPNLLVASKHERHPAELADLAGYRLLFSTETEANRHLAESLVKQITGGEPLKARHMYGDFFTFERTFSIMLITNHRPRITGQDAAIWRRVRLIPWNETVSEQEQRPQDEVVTELLREGPGILSWMLEGLRDWQQNPQWTAPEVLAATEAYRSEQDAIGGFLADCCELGPRFTVGVAELYNVYERFCNESGEEPQTKKVFGTTLKGRGIDQRRIGHGVGRQWVGIRMKACFQQGLEDVVTHGDGCSIKSLREKNIGKFTDNVSPSVTTLDFEAKTTTPGSQQSVDKVDGPRPKAPTPDPLLDNNLPPPVDGPSNAQVISLWHQLGKPPIQLGQAETCTNLEALLSSFNPKPEHLAAVRQWYQSMKGDRPL